MSDNAVIEAKLVVSGRNFEPNHINDFLVVKGAETWRQSRRDLAARTDLANAAWICSTGKHSANELDSIVCKLLGLLPETCPKLVAFSRKHKLDVVIVCNVLSLDTLPTLDFSADTVARAAAWGARISIDLITMSK